MYMDLNYTLYVSVNFYSSKRKHPPILTNEKYYPHFVVKGDSEYLGVNFIDGPDLVAFDTNVLASVLPIYEGVGYDKLTKGTAFFIMEGRNIVGEGEVDEIFPHGMSRG